MFDWNDEELENILWGEAAESDDHIVPYPKGNEGRPVLVWGDQNKKEWTQECITIVNPGKNISEDKTDNHDCQLESTFNFGTNDGHSTSGFRMASWPDLSLSIVANVATTDQGMGTEPNNLNEVMKLDLSREEKASLGKDTEIFQNRHEDKEHGDFVDFGWANIGSFDDLDRIFSNDDPIFGHVSLDSADELWSSSKVGSGPVKLFPLSVDSPSLGLGLSNNASEDIEIKTEHDQHEDQPFTPGCSKWSDSTSPNLQHVHGFMDEVGNAAAMSKPITKDQASLDKVGKTTTPKSLIATDNATTLNKLADKVNKRKKALKYRKKFDGKGKLLQDSYGTWSHPGNQFQQLEKQVATPTLPTCPSSLIGQQRSLQGPESSHYQLTSSLHVTPSTYGNPTNLCSAVPLLSHVHSGEDSHQQMLSEVSLGNASQLDKTVDASVKSLTMTPQEKIEKLRRRQQLQAMLAIQKQQQQFINPVSCANPFIKENQFHFTKGADVDVRENLSNLPPLNPNSPIEQDDSNTISMATDNISLEDTILHHLEDIISKLDIKVRLCIRDSLFRLAQSSLQRHYASDTSSTNKIFRDEHDVAAKEEIKSHNRYATMPGVETETNPIDRTVAHLLFHRPLEMSGKQPGAPGSPISTKLPSERRTAGLLNVPMESSPHSSDNIQRIQGSKTPCAVTEPQDGDQYINSPCVDTSENASNNDPIDGGVMEVDTSR